MKTFLLPNGTAASYCVESLVNSQVNASPDRVTFTPCVVHYTSVEPVVLAALSNGTDHMPGNSVRVCVCLPWNKAKLLYLDMVHSDGCQDDRKSAQQKNTKSTPVHDVVNWLGWKSHGGSSTVCLDYTKMRENTTKITV